MTMQSEHHGVGQSVAGQMAMLTAGLIVLIALAWYFVF